MFPPRLCISAMRPGVKYVADRVKLLPDGSRKLRLVDNDFARSVLLEKRLCLRGVLAPAFVPKLNHFGIVGKSAERSLDTFHIFRRTVESGRILQEKRA